VEGRQQAQRLIDKVKSLIEEQKYGVAMASLTELIKLQLSSDQENRRHPEGKTPKHLGQVGGGAVSAVTGAPWANNNVPDRFLKIVLPRAPKKPLTFNSPTTEIQNSSCYIDHNPL